jgi:hypothetical protein
LFDSSSLSSHCFLSEEVFKTEVCADHKSTEENHLHNNAFILSCEINIFAFLAHIVGQTLSVVDDNLLASMAERHEMPSLTILHDGFAREESMVVANVSFARGSCEVALGSCLVYASFDFTLVANWSCHAFFRDCSI